MRMPQTIANPRVIGFTFLALLVAFGALLMQMTPATELTRFRNALIASVGTPEEFDWEPERMPPSYHAESAQPPPEFMQVATGIRTGAVDTTSLTSRLVEHLRSKPKQRGPIKSTTAQAYRVILETGGGYCADYTQVFNGLAHAAELPVREWGLSFDRFGGDGHAFNEVYDDKTRQWIFVDAMNGFYVRDRTTARPLSVLDFRARLTALGGFDSVAIVPIGNTFLFSSEREAFDYYAAGADEFFLWFGNDVFTYDQHPVVRSIGPWSRSLEQLAAIVIGAHPQIRLLPTDTNAADIQSLLRVPYYVLGLTAAVMLLGVLALLQSVMWLRERRAAVR